MPRFPHRRRLAYATCFSVLGLVLLGAATTFDAGAAAFFSAWCAVCLLILAAAYFRSWPRVFGKTDAGRLRPARAVVMAPYVLLSVIVWRLQNLFLDRQPWSRITPNLFVGRRCHVAMLPPGTTLVIDVTAEFLTPRSIRESVPFLCSPTLDGCAPTLEQCRAAFESVSWDSHPVVYVCCANGAGRSVTFVAMFLGWLGRAGSAEEAITMIRQARREAGPGTDQRAFLVENFPVRPGETSAASHENSAQPG
ncbi:hypothetical protein Pan44_17150 [Caulifigura coniformis]|uniref:Tyrosine specific protein phosphatases domain-containing protein n=1 Tax=Caulifigura coniformis TaxID=2527983 RepID=A0A517SC42_9PLAN|nr:hypothetical protein [Caulifigura coniformis]QDT53692.1 hypothetical protein Pan44_17150 [Caulifigura coniformis]